MAVVVLAGAVDRELATQADALVQGLLLDDGPMAIDVSGVDEVNGALLGVLLRASRRLAWRNRQLYVVCTQPEGRRRLEIAGLDDLATVGDAVPVSRSH